MKRLLTLTIFILFICLLFAFIQHQNNKHAPADSKKPTTNKESTEIDLVKTPLIIKDSYLALWEDEAASQTLNPDGLDSIKEGTETNYYRNYYHGYGFSYPSKWKIDNHQVPNYTRLFHRNFRLDITRQNPAKAWTTKEKFINETISSISEYVTSDQTKTVGNHKVREILYQRAPIEGIENDLTHYAYYFVSADSFVYTFQLKTNDESYIQKQAQVIALIQSMEIFNLLDVDIEKSARASTNHNPSIAYKHKENSLVIPPNHFMFGIYDDVTNDIKTINKDLETHIGAQMFYKPINSTFDHYTKEMADEKRLPIVTVLLQKANEKEVFDINEQLLNGNFDEEIMSWAKEIQTLETPVMVRMGNEMNGKWSEWSSVYNFNDPDIYKLAFRHYVNVFRSIEVDNVYFIWNPNKNASPYYEWNDAALFYPGDNFVDWVGLTAYNFGKTAYGNFQEFDKIYDSLYYDYLRAYSSKPMLIGEFASVEKGGSKAGFIEDFFRDIPTKYPNIKIAIWFNSVHPPYDLTMNTSVESYAAFKNGLKDEHIIQYLE